MLEALHLVHGKAILDIKAMLAWSGCASVPDADEAAAAIDGEDGRSWQLPLPPLNATSFPESYSPGPTNNLVAPLIQSISYV